jgi:hypothetical protein
VTGDITLTNICRLNHTNVISTIANAADTFLSKLADQPCNICLLRWRAATCNNSRELCCYFNEFIFEKGQAKLWF